MASARERRILPQDNIYSSVDVDIFSDGDRHDDGRGGDHGDLRDCDGDRGHDRDHGRGRGGDRARDYVRDCVRDGGRDRDRGGDHDRDRDGGHGRGRGDDRGHGGGRGDDHGRDHDDGRDRARDGDRGGARGGVHDGVRGGARDHGRVRDDGRDHVHDGDHGHAHGGGHDRDRGDGRGHDRGGDHDRGHGGDHDRGHGGDRDHGRGGGRDHAHDDDRDHAHDGGHGRARDDGRGHVHDDGRGHVHDGGRGRGHGDVHGRGGHGGGDDPRGGDHSRDGDDPRGDCGAGFRFFQELHACSGVQLCPHVWSWTWREGSGPLTPGRPPHTGPEHTSVTTKTVQFELIHNNKAKKHIAKSIFQESLIDRRILPQDNIYSSVDVNIFSDGDHRDDGRGGDHGGLRDCDGDRGHDHDHGRGRGGDRARDYVHGCDRDGGRDRDHGGDHDRDRDGGHGRGRGDDRGRGHGGGRGDDHGRDHDDGRDRARDGDRGGARGGVHDGARGGARDHGRVRDDGRDHVHDGDHGHAHGGGHDRDRGDGRGHDRGGDHDRGHGGDHDRGHGGDRDHGRGGGRDHAHDDDRDHAHDGGHGRARDDGRGHVHDGGRGRGHGDVHGRGGRGGGDDPRGGDHSRGGDDPRGDCCDDPHGDCGAGSRFVQELRACSGVQLCSHVWSWTWRVGSIEENIESIVSMVEINATKCKLDYANNDLMKMRDVFLQQLEDDDLNDEVEICIDKCIRLKFELDLKHNGQKPSEKKKEIYFFSAIGSNSQIPDIEKLQYLKGQLRGKALRLVNAFPITADNHVEVWQTLLKRYDNPKDLIFTQIDNALRLPKLADENYNSMFKLLDSCNEIVRTVKVLGYQIDSLSEVIFVKIIQDKLDKTTRKQWELQNNPRVVPSIKDLMEFLEIHAKSLQNLPNKDSNVEKHSMKKELQKVNVYNSYMIKCLKCEGAHALSSCNLFFKLPESERVNFVSSAKLCFRCLKPNHLAKNCYCKNICQICKKRHHTFIHQETKVQEVDEGKFECGKDIKNTTCLLSNEKYFSNVMLTTARIKIKDNNGVPQTCRALIDSGSQANFISGQCRKRLGLKYVTLHSQISGISGHFASHSYGLVEFEFTPHFKSDELFKVNALVLDKLTNNLPTLTCTKSNLAHLKTMPLADPDYNISDPIDILIGAELAMTLFTGESVIGDEEQLTATSSKLGWLLSGRVSSKGSRRGIRNIIQSHHACLET
ncbi:hypothetical protein LAZ67_5000940 [Cordylochernes scorpioides]|uniref:CCHC-type domain-containing protein n=1 Tax=Cordylochernes scorpioides TaxID=51811 RepID=A0ABY6KF89_9ARAC|nr:hypothetical protein LAZ67_5000940 [Cordylochernes scorpioides]